MRNAQRLKKEEKIPFPIIVDGNEGTAPELYTVPAYGHG
jgi:hypothetical protein